MDDRLHPNIGIGMIIDLIYRYGDSDDTRLNLISWIIRKVQFKIANSIGIDGILWPNKKEEEFNVSSLKVFDKELTKIFETCTFSYIEQSGENIDKIPYAVDRIDPGSLSVLFEMSNNLAEKQFSGFVYTQNTEVRIMIILSLLSFLTTIESLTLDAALVLLSEPTNQSDKERMEAVSNYLYGLRFKNSHNTLDANDINMLFSKFLELRVLEPSCGSGSFLVELIRLADIYYQNVVLFARYNHYNNNNNNNNNDKIMEKSDFIRTFISTCVFAVDINPLAVEIARFRILMQYFSIIEPNGTHEKKDLALPYMNIDVGDFLHTPFAFNSKSIKSRKDYASIIQLCNTIMDLRKKSRYNEHLEQIHREQNRLLAMISDHALNSEYNRSKHQKHENSPPFLVGNVELHSDQNEGFSVYKNFCDVVTSGGFNLIIGNPPYVRQEKIISKAVSSESGLLEYKKRLTEMLKIRYFRDILEKSDFEINAQSDYLIYFFYGCFPLLTPNGIHCFITSNSWLDVGYGMDFQEFIVKNMHVELILDNSKVRSFENAEINTVISILRPLDAYQSDHPAKFLVLHQDYQSLLRQSTFKEIISYLYSSRIQSLETPTFRIRSIEQKRLLELGTVHGKYEGLKWGNFLLRAPLIFNKILNLDSISNDLKSKLIRFEDIFYVKGGIKSGANKFFLLEILPKPTDSGEDSPNRQNIIKLKTQNDTILRVKNGYGYEFDIEAQFTRPLLETPKSIEYPRFELNKELEKIRIFYCGTLKSELKGTLALKYIEWAESAQIKTERGKDRGKEVIGVHNLKTFNSKEKWYSIDFPGYSIAIQKIYNTAFRFVVSSESNLIAFDNFHLLKIKDHWAGFSDQILGIFLSSLRVLGINLYGRANFGGGALDIKVFELMQMPFLDPRIITAEETIQMKSAINSILNRPILSYKEEIKQNDLQLIDRIVFSKLGFSQSEITSFQHALSDYIENRLVKANKLKKEED